VEIFSEVLNLRCEHINASESYVLDYSMKHQSGISRRPMRTYK